jgi:4-hydroxy-tetrahydrodipicolinate reductase
MQKPTLKTYASFQTLGIIGKGRMSQEVLAFADQFKIKYVCVDSKSSEEEWRQLWQSEAIIEFAQPEGFLHRLDQALCYQKPFIVGTTGLDSLYPLIEQKTLEAKGRVLITSNFSISVNLFIRHCSKLYQQLKIFEDIELSIHENHHKSKKDAPSGTALQLKAQLSKVDPQMDPKITWDRTDHFCFVHQLHLATMNNHLKLEHEALNRQDFAKGAFVCASWLMNKQGYYTFDQYLDDQLNFNL